MLIRWTDAAVTPPMPRARNQWQPRVLRNDLLICQIISSRGVQLVHLHYCILIRHTLGLQRYN